MLNISKATNIASDGECIEQNESNYPLLRLPRIDLLKYTNGTDQDKKFIVSSFKQYLHEYGSLSLYNHQIPIQLMDDVVDALYNFHRHNNEYKVQFASNGLGTPGFDRFQSHSASNSYDKSDGAIEGDYAEMFAIFNHIAGSNDYNTYYPLKQNLPKELSIIGDYITYIRHILKIVHNIASQALLGMEFTDYFENIMYSNTPHLQLRSYYFAIQNNTKQLIKNNKYRLSEHKDYLGFTLFHPGKQRGLQNKIGGSSGIWIDCQTDGDVEYDIFINAGELFDIWTNGYWMANWHRVLLHNKERLTVSYFSGPDNELMIKPIEGCDVCTIEKPKYIQRNAAQHAQLRFGKGDLNNPTGKKFFSD